MNMIFLSLLAAILGAAAGSFLTVVIPRTKNRQSGILMGRSQCSTCHKKLRPLDLIPVISYARAQGRCRYCKAEIPIYYPLIELVTAIIYVALFWRFGPSIQVFFWFAVGTILVLFAVYDWLYKEFPTNMIIATIVIALTFNIIFQYPLTFSEGIRGAFIPTVFFGTLFLISRKRWLGSGDITFGIFMGLILGWKLTILALVLSYIIGALVCLFLLATKKIRRTTLIPFIPFLATGTLVSILFGRELISHYLALIC